MAYIFNNNTIFPIYYIYFIYSFNSFRNIQGLEYILEGELGTLGNAHETLIDRLHELQVKPTPEMISQTVECCLRPENPEKPLKT